MTRRTRITVTATLTAAATVAAMSVAAVAPALGASARDQDRCRPEVLDMGTLGGSSSEIIESNAQGTWVGSAADADEVQHALMWRRGRMLDLGAVGDAWASDINGAGVVVGNHRESEDWTTGRAFIWRHGVLRELTWLGGGPTYVRRLNERGDATGSAMDRSGTEVPVVWRHGGAPVRLAVPEGFDGAYGMAIDNRRNVVGATYSNARQQLVAWSWNHDGTNGPLAAIDLQGFSQANVLDDRGRAAGISDFGGQPGAQATLWQRGTSSSLGTFRGDDFSFALGTDGRGNYVGLAEYPVEGDEGHVFLTSAGRTGPLRTLMPLSGNPRDFSNAHAVTGRPLAVGGESKTASGETHATVQTCAEQQAFVPDVEALALPDGSAARTVHRTERADELLDGRPGLDLLSRRR